MSEHVHKAALPLSEVRRLRDKLLVRLRNANPSRIYVMYTHNPPNLAAGEVRKTSGPWHLYYLPEPPRPPVAGQLGYHGVKLLDIDARLLDTWGDLTGWYLTFDPAYPEFFHTVRRLKVLERARS
jgi:hypothetical protein